MSNNQPSIISKCDIEHTERTTIGPCCSRDAAKKQVATADEFSTTSELPTNQQQRNETSDSITEIDYLSSKPQLATKPEASQKQKKKTRATKKLKLKATKRQQLKSERAKKQLSSTIVEEIEYGKEEDNNQQNHPEPSTKLQQQQNQTEPKITTASCKEQNSKPEGVNKQSQNQVFWPQRNDYATREKTPKGRSCQKG